MKKFFTLAIAMIATLSVNAQEVLQFDAASIGVTDKDNGNDVAGGTVLAQSDNITIATAFDDKMKPTSCKMNNSGFVIAGQKLTADGLQGSNNPKDVSGANPALTPSVPTEGSVLKITTSSTLEDGHYLYVAAKISSNKNYYVFENGLCIGYELAMWADKESTFQPLKISVENDAEESDVPCRTTPIAWPEVIFTGDEASAKKVNGEGVIVFPVYSNCTYIVGAGGSKITSCGAVLTSSNTVSVVLPETTDAEGTVYPEVTLINEGSTPSGISSVAIDNEVDADTPAYNIAGQRVSKDAKGLVIVGGKKYVNK